MTKSNQSFKLVNVGSISKTTGKKGDEIPIGSRIIAIADAFDSMVTPKVYRNQVVPSVALAKIKEEAGKQFDPNIVECFEQILPSCIRELKELERQSICSDTKRIPV